MYIILDKPEPALSQYRTPRPRVPCRLEAIWKQGQLLEGSTLVDVGDGYLMQ